MLTNRKRNLTRLASLPALPFGVATALGSGTSSKNELFEFLNGARKVHITDLSPDAQERLRQKVYSVLLRRRVPCFYEAIYVEGFHRAHRLRCEHIKNFAAKHGAKRKKEPAPESLHDYLFQGFYGHVFAYCSALGITDMSVEIRTDKVDPPILKRFHSKAKALLSDTIVHGVKRWDPKTSKVNKGNITVKFKGHSRSASPLLAESTGLRAGKDTCCNRCADCNQRLGCVCATEGNELSNRRYSPFRDNESNWTKYF